MIGMLLALVMLSGGCGGSPDAVAPVTLPTQPAPGTTAPSGPVVVQSYSTVVELKDAAVAAGHGLPKLAANKPSDDSFGVRHVLRQTVLSTYATPSQLQHALHLFLSFPISSVLLVGPNWIINAPEAAQLAARMGGTVNRSN